ncbi:LysR substrate-binding domain-containing protein [Azospirillum lipoferum]|uniref:Transcriptional regulator, LysR family n=1 Tax=Azospirillum lipoferum (strain 4B) TaxID=862719 RepID=G7ZC99_AZOL4|nr:LysR substrate-binding domain-containing protein [Azospirillum lipoferum]CBS89212.1 putative transcriptional regulator, LysR family [Azospirillum lipoferum 4B]
MHGLDDMYLFKCVVEAGGLSPAGRRLGMPKSTLARRIGELEERLGLKLFHRGTRQFTLTNFGVECFDHCKTIASEADKLLVMAERARHSPTGFLHVVCPPVLGSVLVETLAAEFLATAPGVRLHLEESFGIFDPRGVQADLVIFPSFTPLPDAALVARKILTSPYILVAHREFVAENGHPGDPADLKSMSCLGLGSRSSDWVWTLTRGDRTTAVRFEPRFSTTLPTALLQAVHRRLGIASLPEALCLKDIGTGDLVRVLGDWFPQPVTIYAIYPNNRTLTVAARQFIDLLMLRSPDILSPSPLSGAKS